jgi:hypothetical protein
MPRDIVREVYQQACTDVVEMALNDYKITSLAGLITRIAQRYQSEVWIKMAVLDGSDSLDASDVLGPNGWKHDEEHMARVERGAAYVRSIAPRIDSENHRRTLLTIIDAAKEGIQLENKELAEILGCIPNTAGMWKLRAFQRARVLLEEDGVMSWEDITEMLPLPGDEDPEYDESDEGQDD